MNQSQSIESAFSRQSEKSKIEYRCRLNASIGCLRYLLMQGLAFRGNDESENSTNQGNFLELLKFIASNNEEIRNVVLGNAPENLKLTSPDIQRDIINAAAFETTKAIILDMGDDLFSILMDECRDVSVKEQMGVVIRYVDSFGCVIERFLGLVHVHDTSATSLLKGIKSLFSNYGLSIVSLRERRMPRRSLKRERHNGSGSRNRGSNRRNIFIRKLFFGAEIQLFIRNDARRSLSLLLDLLQRKPKSCRKKRLGIILE
ncbi:hypothetical protein K2173_017959 [Erythroxylum novogranatense]|uniref:DUF4371 domain-containing protein n=1 Tax=Erythroxylum novogranatense TaxID=1862640 RepID=A0AAV8TWI1_9ROSI|nr:hypothetical protein K2173_017959 [Erythroxylum novogranatense]